MLSACHTFVISSIISNNYTNNILTNNNLHHWADNEENNCSNTSLYFKIADGTGCRFKTADGIWWDISNIENPIIILDEKYKDTDRSELETLAKTEKVDGKKVYVYALVGRRDETTGSIRVNDKSYETTSPNKDYMEKLYGEINSTSNVSVS